MDIQTDTIDYVSNPKGDYPVVVHLHDSAFRDELKGITESIE